MGVLQAIAETEKNIGKRVECIAIDEGQFVEGFLLSRATFSTRAMTFSSPGLTWTFAPFPLEKCST